MRVADMFCGGGGISAGLKLAGFDIVFGLDSSKAAVDTFKHNHVDAEVQQCSIEDVSIDEIPEFDVLVGGPPCVEFSASKQGRGNILAGLQLVQAFLRIVYIRKPKYWIMENVPKIVMHLPEKIPLEWIGIDKPGYLEVPIRTHFLMADYGVPQARERFLMGSFPVPEATHQNLEKQGELAFGKQMKPWVTLQNVLDSLPSPLKTKPSKGMIKDIIYDYDLDINLLSNHFHEVEIPEEESRRIRKAKEAHPFMGWMPFPDYTNRPARTVVATQLGRETLVIGETINGKERYRRATVCECAVIQGYPLTYQILGSGLSARYRVVGNGVPPKLTYHIGREIRKAEGLSVPRKPKIDKIPRELVHTIFHQAKRKAPNHKIDRRFVELVPGKEVRGCRVELTNQGSNISHAQLFTQSSKHLVEWTCRLTIGEGKANMRQRHICLDEAIELLKPLLSQKKELKKITNLTNQVINKITPKLCDASTMQMAWIGKGKPDLNPENLVEDLAAIINKHYPAEEFHETYIPPVHYEDFLPKKGIRVRLGLGLLLTSFCCEVINKSTVWSQENQATRYSDPKWKSTKNKKIIEHPRVIEMLSKASETL